MKGSLIQTISSAFMGKNRVFLGGLRRTVCLTAESPPALQRYSARTLLREPMVKWLTQVTQIKKSLMLFNTVPSRTRITQVRDPRRPGAGKKDGWLSGSITFYPKVQRIRKNQCTGKSRFTPG